MYWERQRLARYLPREKGKFSGSGLMQEQLTLDLITSLLLRKPNSKKAARSFRQSIVEVDHIRASPDIGVGRLVNKDEADDWKGLVGGGYDGVIAGRKVAACGNERQDVGHELSAFLAVEVDVGSERSAGSVDDSQAKLLMRADDLQFRQNQLFSVCLSSSTRLIIKSFVLESRTRLSQLCSRS